MSNSIKIFRRFMTLRSFSRIASSRYFHDGKGEGKDSELEFKSENEPQREENIGEKNEEASFSETKFPQNLPPKEALSNSRKIYHDIFNDMKMKSETSKEVKRRSILQNLSKGSIDKSSERANMISKVDADKSADEIIDGESYETEKEVEELMELKSEANEEVGEGEANLTKDSVAQSEDSPDSFATMLRNSSFIDMGDPLGKLVVGKIYLVVENDLYIDFGWKFHTVCPKPKRNADKFVTGAKVLLKIKDLEMHAKFLGDTSYVSLLEAECEIVKLFKSRKSKV